MVYIYPALALVDLRTTSRSLINIQLVYLYALPTYSINKKSLNTVINRSKGGIEMACDIQMDYGGFTETRAPYISRLAARDMILCKPALTGLDALILSGPKSVTIQPEGMVCFVLKEWRKV